METTRARVGDRGKTVGYGHIADSNVHLNVSVANRSLLPEVQQLLEPFVYDFTRSVRGSISAEHGIGLQKQGKLAGIKSPAQMQCMVQARQTMLKELFDPHRILNPYKLMWK